MQGNQLDICFFLAEYDADFGGHLERYYTIEGSFLPFYGEATFYGICNF
jgi:hypothetical protein